MTENNENKDINPINDEVKQNTQDSEQETPQNNTKPVENVEPTVPTETSKKTSSVKESKSNFNLFKEVWEWFYTILIALLVVAVIKGFIFDIVHVSGSSMLPTLVDGDKLFVSKINYEPEAGDIIILDSNYVEREQYYADYEEQTGEELNWLSKKIMYYKIPEELDLKRFYYVKRIIGMPGDEIDIKNGLVYVNGEPIDEPYIDTITTTDMNSVSFPQTVEEGHVFVLGDNRHPGGSTDSRAPSLGQVPFEAIIGKSQFRIWPFSAFGKTE